MSEDQNTETQAAAEAAGFHQAEAERAAQAVEAEASQAPPIAPPK